MPRGCKPTGDHALSNAERQARYRARQQVEAATAVTRLAPSVGVTPSAHYLRCRLRMPSGSRHSPIASKAARQPMRSKPSSIST
jgi:hypothetical protein